MLAVTSFCGCFCLFVCKKIVYLFVSFALFFKLINCKKGSTLADASFIDKDIYDTDKT